MVWIMYAFTPLAMFFWTLNKNVTAFAVWAGELLSNAFMQTAFAFVTAIVFSFVNSSVIAEETMWFYSLLGIFMIPAVAKVIRNGLQGLWTRWAGIDEDSLASGSTNILTAVGAASLGRVAQATFGKGKPGPGSPSPESFYPAEAAEEPAAYNAKSPDSFRSASFGKEDPASFGSIEDDYTPENTAVFNGSPFETLPNMINTGRNIYEKTANATRAFMSVGAGLSGLPQPVTQGIITGTSAVVGKVAQGAYLAAGGLWHYTNIGRRVQNSPTVQNISDFVDSAKAAAIGRVENFVANHFEPEKRVLGNEWLHPGNTPEASSL